MAIGRRVVPTRYGDYDLPAGRIDKVWRRALLDLLVGLFVPAAERAAAESVAAVVGRKRYPPLLHCAASLR
jgi:hypothetical protein